LFTTCYFTVIVFRNVTPCSVLHRYQYIGAIFCLLGRDKKQYKKIS